MNNHQEPLNDVELDELLAAASSPPPIKGFEERLLSRMTAVHSVAGLRDNVVPFVRPLGVSHERSRSVSHRISIAAALAASLIIGILISDNTVVADVVDGVTGLTSSGQVAEFAPAGIDDIGPVDEENQS